MQPSENRAVQGTSADTYSMLDSARLGTERLNNASSAAEGRWILVLGLTVAFASAAMQQVGASLISPVGITSLVVVYTLAILVSWRRSVNRTVRPRYFSVIFNIAMLAVGVAMGAASYLIIGPDGGPPAMAVSALTGLVVAAPVFACGIWLMARRR